ncbi:MAG: asparagine synthase (glutamine-hydrolyzing), partial [Candidatus Hydrogenedentes bacterium]|nr:asparagine synthase (glutamine-hydrolyzing) [Candidatus Hydrogenedentota bacterium]
MCGIAGQAGAGDIRVVQAMCNRLAHRGPDDEGFYQSEGVCLGHRRLSIIDLSGGHQPIANEDETVWIVFNGEIYNFQELRADLEAHGHVFRTNSDTEAIIHAYEEYGEQCPARLFGMFAFAIWDSNQQKLFAARDHAGVKPLYYAEHEGSLLFASEIKALLAAGVSRQIDYCSLDDYLTYLYTVPPRTLFRDVKQLPPAHSLTWQDNRLTVRRYWKLEHHIEERSEDGWVEEIRSCLQSVIEGNMIADVPLGSFLSGGLDSSTIVAMMSRVRQDPVRTFTIGFGGDGNLYDEVEEARAIARHFHTDHQELQAQSGIVELLPTVIRHFDEPFGNPTALLAYILSGEIRKHVTVALAGDGGDELFGGYARYVGAAWAERYRLVPDPIRRWVINPLVQMLPESTRGRHALRRLREFSSGALLSPEAMYTSWVTYFGEEEREALYTGDFRAKVKDHDSLAYIRRLFGECTATDIVSRAMYVDANSFMPNNVLQYSDRMSMAHALEIRVPFTDPRLMELMARVPSSLKIRGGETKYLMRRVMRPDLPSEVLSRKKIGFNPPMGVWLKTSLTAQIEDLLSKQAIEARGYFRPESIQAMLSAHRNSQRDFTWHIWSLLFLELWHRMYIDSPP